MGEIEAEKWGKADTDHNAIYNLPTRTNAIDPLPEPRVCYQCGSNMKPDYTEQSSVSSSSRSQPQPESMEYS